MKDIREASAEPWAARRVSGCAAPRSSPAARSSAKPSISTPARSSRTCAWPRACSRAKGDIAPGLDADLALVDPRSRWTVRARESESTQGYTPFEGIELGARVEATFLRGELVCEDGKVLGAPRGRYLHRPTD